MEDVIFADLHIHSRFSRACSKNITIPELVKWAKVKGLNLLGTSDFTHPVWLSEIKELLVEKNSFYYYQGFPFILSVFATNFNPEINNCLYFLCIASAFFFTFEISIHN